MYVDKQKKIMHTYTSKIKESCIKDKKLIFLLVSSEAFPNPNLFKNVSDCLIENIFHKSKKKRVYNEKLGTIVEYTDLQYSCIIMHLIAGYMRIRC